LHLTAYLPPTRAKRCMPEAMKKAARKRLVTRYPSHGAYAIPVERKPRIALSKVLPFYSRGSPPNAATATPRSCKPRQEAVSATIMTPDALFTPSKRPTQINSVSNSGATPGSPILKTAPTSPNDQLKDEKKKRRKKKICTEHGPTCM